jgi:CRP-like cAMP-binding protein
VVDDELEHLQKFKSGERHVDAGDMVIAEGATPGRLYTVLEGWAIRFKTLSDGRRQILNFLLPGDFLGLQERLSDVSPVGVEALTPMRLCSFPLSGLWPLYARFPSLGFDVTWLVAHEESIVDDTLLSVGRRTALESVAMLLLHLHKRATQLDLATDGCVAFPVTQTHIADALGLSLVHVNRTMRRLRQLGLYALDAEGLRLPNPRALARLADWYGTPPRVRPLI